MALYVRLTFHAWCSLESASSNPTHFQCPRATVSLFSLYFRDLGYTFGDTLNCPFLVAIMLQQPKLLTKHLQPFFCLGYFFFQSLLFIPYNDSYSSNEKIRKQIYDFLEFLKSHLHQKKLLRINNFVSQNRPRHTTETLILKLQNCICFFFQTLFLNEGRNLY